MYDILAMHACISQAGRVMPTPLFIYGLNYCFETAIYFSNFIDYLFCSQQNRIITKYVLKQNILHYVQKLRRRTDMLSKSATWPEADKAEYRNGMQMTCMSPEESEEEEEEEEEEENSSDSDEEQPRQKVLKVHPLSWRSERFMNLLNSLDRKHNRKMSVRARAMMKKRKTGETIVRQAPENVPAWMVKTVE